MKTAPLHRSVPSVRHSLTVLPNERSEGGRQGRRSDEWRDEPLSCHLSRYAERLIHSSRLPLRPALRALGRFLRHSSSVPSGVPQARNERRTTVGTWDTSEAPKGRPLGSLSLHSCRSSCRHSSSNPHGMNECSERSEVGWRRKGDGCEGKGAQPHTRSG